jgi:hypothetical protein
VLGPKTAAALDVYLARHYPVILWMGTTVAWFAVSEDGRAHYELTCDNTGEDTCASKVGSGVYSSVPQNARRAAIKRCEEIAKTPCKILFRDHDKLANYRRL